MAVRVKFNGQNYAFWCVACGCRHFFDERWAYNGDPERPTVSPSIRVPATGCHVLLTGGRAQYLWDAAHALAGRVVDVPPLA